MDKEEEQQFNRFAQDFFSQHQRHHNVWGAYDFEPRKTRSNRPHSWRTDNWQSPPEGTITFLSKPTKVKPEAYANKSRRFRENLKLTVKETQVVQDYSAIGSGIYYIKVEGEGQSIVPIGIVRQLKNSTLITWPMEKFLYLCIVESQYIEFEELTNG